MLLRKWKNRVFCFSICLLTTVSVLALGCIVFFLVKESWPLLQQIGLLSFLCGSKWSPVSYVGEASFQILPIILATIYISCIAVAIALFVGVGCAVFYAYIIPPKGRKIMKPFIDLLAGIPSVVYGFIGLLFIVKGLEYLGQATGESILAGGVLLAVMILPFMVSSCGETMVKLRERYHNVSASLGVTKWYMINQLIMPASVKGIWMSVVLSLGRAMGETMAVMMVIGNAPIFPALLGKGQTIPSLIALEMGMVEVGSLHYSALFAAGLVLLIILLALNITVFWAKSKIKN